MTVVGWLPISGYCGLASTVLRILGPDFGKSAPEDARPRQRDWDEVPATDAP